MSFSLAYLGPSGTYSEAAALAYTDWIQARQGITAQLCAQPSIPQTLRAVTSGQVDVAVVPVENSIEGSVAVTLDLFWQLDGLQIQQAMVLPIVHALVSEATDLAEIVTVYSHPQALGQCQQWLEQHLPQAQLMPTRSTTEALQILSDHPTAGAIASEKAAQLYDLPVRVNTIQDYPDNCTRFWVVTHQNQPLPAQPSRESGQVYTSLAFSVPDNVPGVLVKPLQIMAERQINLSRIESRPSKRSLGDYVFFFDLEGNLMDSHVSAAVAELKSYTEILKIFGSYVTRVL